jgi:hypothetical protein
MKKTTAFVRAVAKPTSVKDSRFGIRKQTTSPQVSPSVFSYASPGRGANGEHQN